MGLPPPGARDDRNGVIYVGLCYVFWGVAPLYWRLLGDLPPLEVAVHRVLWCAVFALMTTVARGHLFRALGVVRDPRTLATLALTSVLISINWTLYIYSVATNQLVEASLGYFSTPLISFALGMTFFRERLSRLRLACVALATAALVVQIVALGQVPWIAAGLAVSFGFYGYFRKRAAVAAMDGLMVETAFLLPFAMGMVLWWAAQGTGVFLSGNLTRDALLMSAGPITAIPLALFAAGVRHIRMSTIGFLQYLAPSLTLLLAVVGFGEAFTTVDMISFGCVWTALVIVAFEGRRFGAPQSPAGEAPRGAP